MRNCYDGHPVSTTNRYQIASPSSLPIAKVISWGVMGAHPQKNKDMKMMRFFKKKEDRFVIEYYPLTGLYFPKWNGWYLKEVYMKGTITTEDYFPVAECFRREDSARAFIEKFREQRFKTGMIKINIP